MKVSRLGNTMLGCVDRTRYNAQHGINLVAKVDSQWEIVPIEKRRWASSRRKVKR